MLYFLAYNHEEKELTDELRKSTHFRYEGMRHIQKKLTDGRLGHVAFILDPDG